MADLKRISPAEAQALVAEGWVYLDVRSEPEFAAGHPVGAHNVPLQHVGPGVLRSPAGAWPSAPGRLAGARGEVGEDHLRAVESPDPVR